jgi:hypothetical protein
MSNRYSSDRSELLRSRGFRLANRVGAALLATVSALASWNAALGLRHAYRTSGISVLHPSAAIVRPLAVVIFAITSVAYFGWAAFRNRAWILDGQDLDRVV